MHIFAKISIITIMKKILIIAILSLVAMASANAQMAKYREIKDIYSARNYVPSFTDPYNRALAGLGSLLVPGLGHVFIGETGRGLLFLGGDIAMYFVANYQAYSFASYCITDENGTVTGYTDEAAAAKYAGRFVLSLFGMAAVNIWACVDAVKVAKVKNMYYQEHYGNRYSLNFGLEPFFSFTPTAATPSGSSLTPAAGMTLKLNF